MQYKNIFSALMLLSSLVMAVSCGDDASPTPPMHEEVARSTEEGKIVLPSTPAAKEYNGSNLPKNGERKIPQVRTNAELPGTKNIPLATTIQQKFEAIQCITLSQKLARKKRRGCR